MNNLSTRIVSEFQVNDRAYIPIFAVFFLIVAFFHSASEYPDGLYYQKTVCEYPFVNEFLDRIYYRALFEMNDMIGGRFCSYFPLRNPDFTGFGRFQSYALSFPSNIHFEHSFLRLLNFFIFLIVLLLTRCWFLLMLPMVFYTSFLTSDIFVILGALLFFKWPRLTSLVIPILLVFNFTSETVLILIPCTFVGVWLLEISSKYFGKKKTIITFIILSLMLVFIAKHLLATVSLGGETQLEMAIAHNNFGSNTFLALFASLFGAYGYMSYVNFMVAIFLGYRIVMAIINKSFFWDISEKLLFISVLIAVVISSVFPWVSQIRFYPLVFASFYNVMLALLKRNSGMSEPVSAIFMALLSLPFIMLTWS